MLKIYYTKTDKNTRENERIANSELLAFMLKEEGIEKFLIAKTESGKPYLIDLPYKIGITHKNGYCFVAISDGEVGVDLEKMHDNNPVMARRILPDDEFEAYIISNEPEKMLFFAFSAREAASKFTGEGFPFLLSREKITEPLAQELLILDGEEYVLSVCAENSENFSFKEIKFVPFSSL